MPDENNKTLEDISLAAGQIAASASQISDGAQALATGSTEQAATIQQVSATMGELQQTIAQNANSSKEANAASMQAGAMLQEVIASSAKAKGAMDGIKEESDKMAKVVKVIEDIAFQTNILALNAAVEAARAGQHGKGFAVVADEVRNLASKSSTAAKETAEMIQTSAGRVEEGIEILGAMNGSLVEVGDSAESAISLMGDVSVASANQATQVDQVNAAIAQVSQVIQSNAANSEESAASAEEMNAQAAMMKQLVGQYRIKGAGVAQDISQRNAIAFAQGADCKPELPAPGAVIF